MEVTGAASPFSGIDVGNLNSPDLVDLDGDGDIDAIVGMYGGYYGGELTYFENTGTSSSPGFVEATGAANPFQGINVGNGSNPNLVDLDGDGDLDAVVGGYYGLLKYLENTGSSSSPAFVQATGAASPFFGFNVGYSTCPDLVDLDGDGDLDALIGEQAGHLIFFRSLAVVFSDGLESGNTSAWADTFPAP